MSRGLGWTFALGLLVSGCGDAADADALTDAGPNGESDRDGAIGLDGGPGDVDGGAPNGGCAAPSVVSLPESTPYPRGTRTLELSVELDVPVSVDDDGVSYVGDGRLGGVAAQDRRLVITVEELFNGARGRLLIEPSAVVNADCGAGLSENLEVDVEVAAESWEHVGPIRTTELSERGEPWFEEVTEAAGFGASGSDSRAMLVDFDGDGDDDLVTIPVTTLPLRPRFFQNRARQGGFGFEEVTTASGMAEADVTLLVFGDVDEDGDADAVALTGARSPDGRNGVWLNDGAGAFTFAGARGLTSSLIGTLNDGSRAFHEPAAATLVDFDRDGDLDLYVGRFYVQILAPNGDIGSGIPTDDELYLNDGSGSFTQVGLPEQLNELTRPYLSAGQADITGRAAYGLATGDWDDDGDVDLFVHNYGAGRPALGSQPLYWDHNLLWRNDLSGTFVDVAPDLGLDATLRGTTVQDELELGPVTVQGQTFPSPIGGNGFGCAFGDFDNDGDLDLISATIAHPDYPHSDRTLLFVNQGGGASFTEESRERGLEYAEDELHPALVDIDQDGRMDLAMSRLRNTRMEFYLQSDDHRFARQSYAVTGVDITRPGPTLWTDLDGDGDLDFFMPKGAGRVFENRAGDGRNWLKLRLIASAPREAIGARVTMQTSAGTLLREVVSGHGHYNTQPSRWLHFGLGGDSGAADVTIRWPDGTEQTLGAVRAQQALTISQGGEITED